MENKNTSIIIGAVILILGLFIGYYFGTSTTSRGIFNTDSMHQEMEEYMLGEDFSGDTDLQHMMDEMMIVGRGLTGEAYEEAWLRGMVVHHIGAIEMSKELLRQTDRPELVQLANNIIESQSEEVDQMKVWINTWFETN